MSYIKHDFRYEALDKNLQNPKDITHIVEGGSVTYDCLSRLQSACSLTMSLGADEDCEIEAVRIYSIVNDVENCLGTFYNKIPSRSFEDEVQELEIELYSTLIRLSTNCPDRKYFVPQGTNCINEVKRILQTLGYTANIPEANLYTNVDKEFELGEYYLDIINYLLNIAGFTPLYTDVYGTFEARPYVLPQNRPVDILLSQDDVNSVLENKQVSTIDTLSVPNKFIRYCSNSPEMDLVAVYTNTEGITGTGNTWVNANVEEVNDIASYDVLYELCKKSCYEATSLYHTVEISVAPTVQLPTYLPLVQLKHYKEYAKFEVTSMDIDLSVGGSIDLVLREGVTV